MGKSVYKRILLKLSGEALAGEGGIGLDFNIMTEVSGVIRQCIEAGCQVAVVVGGGNFWRGVKNGQGKMERSNADHMGMLATVMNAIAFADVLNQTGVRAVVQTGVEMRTFADPYTQRDAVRHLEEGTVVVFGAGTGSPYFTTDTGAVLRAVQIHADALLLAKNIDAVYSADPKKDPNAVRYTEISYNEMLERRLMVIDYTATALAMDNSLPVELFGLSEPANILKVVTGEKIGTTIK